MNETNYFKAWAIFFLASLVGGLLAGAFAGAILGVIIGALNEGDPEAIKSQAPLFTLIGFIATLPVSFVCYKWTVSNYILPQANG